MIFIHPVIDHEVYLAQQVDGLSFAPAFRCFRPKEALRYEAYCDDFGPMNMASIVDFTKLLDAERKAFPDTKIVFCADEGRRALTNSVFLLGAYMILKLDMTPCSVTKRFTWLDPESIEPYRDATYTRPDFRLQLFCKESQPMSTSLLRANSACVGECSVQELPTCTSARVAG
jgi:hypothetical protein